MTVDRLHRLREAMDERGVDCLFLAAGPDLRYLTGYAGEPLERPTVLVVPLDGPAVLVVPALEAPGVPPGPVEVRAWRDGEDPLGLIVSAARRPTVAGIGDDARAVLLLELFAQLTETTFVPASPVTARLRERKGPDELAALRTAAAAVDAAVRRLAADVPVLGRSERAVARDAAELLVECGHDRALFTIVGSGPNGASPHHIPGDRVVGPGDAVVVDFGGERDGYCSDLTRTFVAGEPSGELVAVHAVVAAAQEAARRAVAPGVAAGEVDGAARAVVAAAGYGDRFIHRTGHGIGLAVHEEPYLVAGSERRLEEGMVFSLEPGIYLPGAFGVRIEDIVAVTPTGCELLTTADRSLLPVE